MARTSYYFLSDSHLGASYVKDPHEHEKTLVSFLESIREDAIEVFLLGDILDYWFEYKTVVPRGYVRFFGELARLVDSGVKVHWFIGNHDIWIFDYLRDEIGIYVHDGFRVYELYGKNFFLTHGDGVGEIPGAFKYIRKIFRNKVCQKLYSGIHPRWTIPFAHGWSRHSRESNMETGVMPFAGENESLIKFAREYLKTEDPYIDYFVFGHRHVAQVYPITPQTTVIYLGEWVNMMTYLRFDGETLEFTSYLHPDKYTLKVPYEKAGPSPYDELGYPIENK